MFSVLNTASSGMGVYQTWLNAISGNIANMNDASPTNQKAYQARYIMAKPSPAGLQGVGQGASVAGVALGSAKGILTYSPSNPLANAQGYVRMPSINLAQQMTQLIMAQRGYQLNAVVVTQATQAYKSALTL